MLLPDMLSKLIGSLVAAAVALGTSVDVAEMGSWHVPVHTILVTKSVRGTSEDLVAAHEGASSATVSSRGLRVSKWSSCLARKRGRG